MSVEPKIILMAHMIAGYPDMPTSELVAEGLRAGGAGYLEVQFPYSDPTADGPAIQEACHDALKKGFHVDQGFALVRRLTGAEEASAHMHPPVFIMSYAGLVFARGVRRFVEDAAAAGATGLIVPDLMPGYDEGLYDLGDEHGLAVVPVVAPSVSETRLDEILAVKSPFLYAAIRTGITGTRSTVDESVSRFLDRLRRPGTRIIAGFGIVQHDQAVRLQRFADILVVGSAFVRAAEDAHAAGRSVAAAVEERACEITGRKHRIEEEEEAAYRRRDSVGG